MTASCDKMLVRSVGDKITVEKDIFLAVEEQKTSSQLKPFSCFFGFITSKE